MRVDNTAHGSRLIPLRVLLLLGAAVVVAHGLILRNVSMQLQGPARLSTGTFITRTVQIKAPPAKARPLPQRPVTQAPRPRPTSKRPVRPTSEGVLSATARLPGAVAELEREPAPPPQPPPPAVVVEAIAEPPAQSEMPFQRDVIAPQPVPVPDPAPAPAPEPVAVAVAPQEAASAPAADIPAPAASAPASQPGPDARIATRPYTVPGSIRLNFDAVGKKGRLEYKAMGSLTWLQDGASYDMRLEMGDWIIGKRVLSSSGKVTGDGLAPSRFADKFRSERSADFDRQRGRITFSANTPSATLAAGAQDQLSIFAQLAALVAGDPLAFPIGTTLTIQTVGPRDAEPWVFAVEREEMLYLPGGQLPTLKLTRRPNKDYGQTVELWLAPELAFLPARIKITFENGDYLDQQWKSSSTP
jgi:hypothetical protein